MSQQLRGRWRHVAGVVQDRNGEPVMDCHVDVLPLTVGAELLDIAVFSDERGRWAHELHSDAAYELVAAPAPGQNIGSVTIPAGHDDLADVVLVARRTL